MNLLELLLGVKCRGCGKRKSLEQFHGCAKCGKPYCKLCTSGGLDSRICSPCESGR